MGDIGFHAAGHRCIHGKPNAELPDPPPTIMSILQCSLSQMVALENVLNSETDIQSLGRVYCCVWEFLCIPTRKHEGAILGLKSNPKLKLRRCMYRTVITVD